MNKLEKFEKKNLTTGMQVHLRNEERYIVMLDTKAGNVIVNVLEKSYCLLTNYRKNLTNVIDKQFDVIRIYESNDACSYLNMLPVYNEIWRREHKIEVTVRLDGKKVLPSEIPREKWNNIRENN